MKKAEFGPDSFAGLNRALDVKLVINWEMLL